MVKFADDIAGVQEHACGEIQALLGTARDQDMVGICLNAVFRFHPCHNMLSQRRIALCGSILQSCLAAYAFKACEPKFIDIPTDDNGMIMEELEKVLASTENIKMIYVIPDFQNPSGRTWTMERRQKFMEIINKYEVPVIEDNPYGELRFEGQSLPSLKSMDTKGLVIFLGTFSKILAPGYRLGWVCAESEILGKYNFMKQAADLQASSIGQMETAKFLDLYNLDDHVEKIKAVYVKRRDYAQRVLVAAVREEAAAGYKCNLLIQALHLQVFCVHVIGQCDPCEQAAFGVRPCNALREVLFHCLQHAVRRRLLPERRPREHAAHELLLHARRKDYGRHQENRRSNQSEHEIKYCDT